MGKTITGISNLGDRKRLASLIRVGDEITIINMVNEPRMAGKHGTVTSIDDDGVIHGTWGLAILADVDEFEVFEGRTA